MSLAIQVSQGSGVRVEGGDAPLNLAAANARCVLARAALAAATLRGMISRSSQGVTLHSKYVAL